MADLIPQICEMNRQLDLKLPDMTRRALVRLHLAHAIESKVLPLTDDHWFHSLPERLRNARKDFCLGFRPADSAPARRLGEQGRPLEAVPRRCARTIRRGSRAAWLTRCSSSKKTVVRLHMRCSPFLTTSRAT